MGTDRPDRAKEEGLVTKRLLPPPPPPKRSSLARALAFWTSAASLAGDMDCAASSAGDLGPAPPLKRLRPGVSKTLLLLCVVSSSSPSEATSSPNRSLNFLARAERSCVSPLLLLLMRPLLVTPPLSPVPFPLLAEFHNTLLAASPVFTFLLAREPALFCALVAPAERGAFGATLAAASMDPAERLTPPLPRPPFRG